MAKAKSKVTPEIVSNVESDKVAQEMQDRVDSFAKGVKQLSELYKIGIVLTLDYTQFGIVPQMRFKDKTEKENEPTQPTTV